MTKIILISKIHVIAIVMQFTQEFEKFTCVSPCPSIHAPLVTYFCLTKGLKLIWCFGASYSGGAGS
eukprot:12907355-Prorocentrum_lima.AAC.1